MKRSKKVLLLAPLALAACGKSDFASQDECTAAANDKQVCRAVAGSRGLYYVHVPAYSGRWGTVPSPARGGFGVAGRAPHRCNEWNQGKQGPSTSLSINSPYRKTGQAWVGM